MMQTWQMEARRLVPRRHRPRHARRHSVLVTLAGATDSIFPSDPRIVHKKREKLALARDVQLPRHRFLRIYHATLVALPSFFPVHILSPERVSCLVIGVPRVNILRFVPVHSWEIPFFGTRVSFLSCREKRANFPLAKRFLLFFAGAVLYRVPSFHEFVKGV